ncbi:30S ribosomal protein S1 [bacterium]|nr:30S ribosomal protein S1 [bacterium]
MGEDILENQEISMEEVLSSEPKNSLKEREIIWGEIIKIDSENVFVDVGLKSEGVIPLIEFGQNDENIEIKAGKKIEVYLKKIEGKTGCPVLSYEQACNIKMVEKLKSAYQNGEPVEGKVKGKVKGGLCINIGKDAFLPHSQVSLKFSENLDQFVGQKLKVKITRFSSEENNIVVSSRIILEKEREENKNKRVASLKEGEVCCGVVKRITDFGAFVDIGGVDGLLHKNDISWGRVDKVGEFLKEGEEIKVKIISFNPDTQKISLGLKQLTPHPWENIESKYPIESLVSGRVRNITKFGFFVEIEKGVEGLVHISEISWTKRIKHPSEVVSRGALVKARVLNIDKDNKKISLGIKQIGPNPWERIKEKYSVGMKLSAKVSTLTSFGAFVKLEEGIEGVVHLRNMSWTKKVKHPEEILHKNDLVEVTVLDINVEEEKISLGLKQAGKNPYLNYKKGNKVTGQIIKAFDFGYFVKIEEGIEGILRSSQISNQYMNKSEESLKVGDEIVAKIIGIDYEEGKINLSIKELEKEEMHKHMQLPSFKMNLGDILGDKLNKFKKDFKGD